jgi:predicted phosphodiesterase
VHYGERASRVHSLRQLAPLCEGASSLVLNGDSLDTRPGPRPQLTERWGTEVREFFGGIGIPVTFVTGNHDPDFSATHSLDLAAGQVFAVHGDVVFEAIVPWGRDAFAVRRMIREELAALPPGSAERLEDRLAAFRRVAGRVRQRHQAERHRLKYVWRIALDTAWPPWRIVNIPLAWRAMPGRAAGLARRHRPRAKFVLVGHSHWPGVWRFPGGPTVINTGSFTYPLGAYAVDLFADRLLVRRVRRQGSDFLPGEAIAEFGLPAN